MCATLYCYFSGILGIETECWRQLLWLIPINYCLAKIHNLFLQEGCLCSVEQVTSSSIDVLASYDKEAKLEGDHQLDFPLAAMKTKMKFMQTELNYWTDVTYQQNWNLSLLQYLSHVQWKSLVKTSSNEGDGGGSICNGDTVVVWCINAGGVRLLSDGGESGLAPSSAPSWTWSADKLCSTSEILGIGWLLLLSLTVFINKKNKWVTTKKNGIPQNYYHTSRTNISKF